MPMELIANLESKSLHKHEAYMLMIQEFRILICVSLLKIISASTRGFALYFKLNAQLLLVSPVLVSHRSSALRK